MIIMEGRPPGSENGGEIPCQPEYKYQNKYDPDGMSVIQDKVQPGSQPFQSGFPRSAEDKTYHGIQQDIRNRCGYQEVVMESARQIPGQETVYRPL